MKILLKKKKSLTPAKFRDYFFFCFLALCYELMKAAARQQRQRFLKMEKTFRLQAEQPKKSFTPGTTPARASALGKAARAHSAGIPADTGKGSSELGRTVILQTRAPKVSEWME